MGIYRDECIIEVDRLANELIEGRFSEVTGRWLERNVPGLEVARLPPLPSTKYRQIEATLEYWNGLPKIEGVADTLVVDPLELVPALGSLMLLDVIDEGRDFRYSLYGSRIAQISGFDMTGKSLAELPTQSAIRTLFRAGYLGVVRHRKPLFTVHRAPENIMIGKWHRLQLPLGKAGRVQRILVCNVGTRPDGEEK